jgi:hypothetical protein
MNPNIELEALRLHQAGHSESVARAVASVTALYRYSIAYTGQQMLCGKEGDNRTSMTLTGADIRG